MRLTDVAIITHHINGQVTLVDTSDCYYTMLANALRNFSLLTIDTISAGRSFHSRDVRGMNDSEKHVVLQAQILTLC